MRDDGGNTALKQFAFLKACTESPNAIALYGGAGGGMKSNSLRKACVYSLLRLAELGFPKQRVTLACSTYNLLIDRHVGKLVDEYGHFGEYRANHGIYGRSFVFSNPDLGVILLRNLDDPDKYRGTEVAGVFPDELTELPPYVRGHPVFPLLMYPLRSTQRLPFMPFGAGSNPDGVGFGWVKDLWINGNTGGYDKNRFVYIPAKVYDNPWATPEMVANFESLTGYLRASRLEGSWAAPEGARWPQLDPNVHKYRQSVKFPKGMPDSYRRWIGYDYGKQAPYAALWLCADFTGDLYLYREDYQRGLSTTEQGANIRRLTGLDEHIEVIRADPTIFNKPPTHDGKQGEQPSIGTVLSDSLTGDKRFGSVVRGYQMSRGRAIGLAMIDKLLDRDNGYPNLYIEESCIDTWRELETAVWDTRSNQFREDLHPDSPDHAITALVYGAFDYVYPSEPQVTDWEHVKRTQEMQEEHDRFRDEYENPEY